MRKAFDAASMVSGLSFQEINDSDTVQIRVGVNQQTNTKGYSFSPDRSQAALAGDIWLDVETVADLGTGKEGFWVMLHELGHALGLRHPALIGQAKGQATITAQQDNMGYSVMSENLGLSGRFPESFSVYDVLALQALYGPSQSNLGNSTYVVGTASVLGLKTLVDGSGWDIIDASQSSIGVTVNLNPGSLSSVGRTPDDYAAFENLAIAYGTTIEQVNGSVYDDVLIGSQGNDWFVPGEGNDQIEGRAGFDTVVMAGPRAAFSLSISPFSGRTIVTAKDGVSGSDSLTGIERLKFTDGGVAFDMDGAAGRLVKLMATVLG
ncbi:MAG: M10 family metallopeptidase, partial [Burkholderiaceae bacterium]